MIRKSDIPVSCLMVTLARSGLVDSAVQSFKRQLWPHKELVVVYDNLSVESALRELAIGDDRIKLWREPPGRSLGELRNAARQHAQGEILIQWDDDDQYHPTRLDVQVTHLLSSNARAAVLGDQLLFFVLTHELFWVDRAGLGGIEGTLACYAADMPEYPPLSRSEDSAIARAYRHRQQLTVMAEGGLVYLRTFHGGNTWSRGHFDRYRRMSRNASAVRRRSTELLSHLSAYSLGDQPVEVRGCDRMVGTYDPTLSQIRFVD